MQEFPKLTRNELMEIDAEIKSLAGTSPVTRTVYEEWMIARKGMTRVNGEMRIVPSNYEKVDNQWHQYVWFKGKEPSYPQPPSVEF